MNLKERRKECMGGFSGRNEREKFFKLTIITKKIPQMNKKKNQIIVMVGHVDLTQTGISWEESH